MSALLDDLLNRTSGDQVSLGNLLDVVGRRSYGPVLLLLGILAISPLTAIPGVNWVIAFITFIFAAQMAIGRREPWLPKKVLALQTERAMLEKIVSVLQPLARTVDRIVKPRLEFLTEPPALFFISVMAVGATLITFPLGVIPFAAALPGATILLIGLALTAEDGVMALLAAVAFAASLYVTDLLITELILS